MSDLVITVTAAQADGEAVTRSVTVTVEEPTA